MKLSAFACTVFSTVTLVACGSSAPATPPAPPPAPPTAGFDRANFDTSVRPQDDLYQYVNGGWLKKTELPAEKSSYGSFDQLFDLTESQVKGIIEKFGGSWNSSAPSLGPSIAATSRKRRSPGHGVAERATTTPESTMNASTPR